MRMRDRAGLDPAGPGPGEVTAPQSWRRRALGRHLFAFLAAALAAGPSALAASPEIYDVDVSSSRVRVQVDRAGLLGFLGHDHEFDAPLSGGYVEVDRNDPAASVVDLHWDASALAVVPGTEPAEDVREVEQRMRGPEVLDVKHHPRIRFWSFEVEVLEAEPGAGRWRLHLHGGLEIKGDRHTIEMDAEVVSEGGELTASGRANLRLRRLGIHPPSVAGVVKVADEIRVVFEVHASPRAALPSLDGADLRPPRSEGEGSAVPRLERASPSRVGSCGPTTSRPRLGRETQWHDVSI